MTQNTDTSTDTQYELLSGFSPTRGMMWALFGLAFLTAYLALSGDTQEAAELAATGAKIAALMIGIELLSGVATELKHRYGSTDSGEVTG